MRSVKSCRNRKYIAAHQNGSKTGAGIKRKSAYKSHILTKMTTKRKRQLRGTSVVNPADLGNVKRMLRLD